MPNQQFNVQRMSKFEGQMKGTDRNKHVRNFR